jgi:hypothetical protein
MHFRIRWSRALAIASGLTLIVAGATPATASAHGGRKVYAANRHRASVSVPSHGGAVSATSHAKSQVGQARGRTLIFGGGDEADASLGINPTEPLTNLENILTEAGYGVDVSATLPARLNQYRAIWYLDAPDTPDTEPLSTSEESELEAYVNSGHGLYLTGEPDDCCEGLNTADTAIINALVTGGGVQAGGQGDANDGTAPESVNGSAIDNVAQTPNTLTSWTPDGPGGMAGVTPNALTSTYFGDQLTPTGAVWDGSDMTSGHGRLAILMNINWLEAEYWDQLTATQMAVNLERFLMSSTPVPDATKAGWAGYAATAHGVRDVTGEWTVPTIDCTQASEASAVGVWVGIDGFGNNKLVKAGLGVTCASPTATPCYYLFTEVLPGTESPITGCGGVSPGDSLSADVTNSPFGSSTFVITMMDNGSSVGGSPISVTAPTKRDRSAECVVQLPPGNVGPTPAHYTELADFGSVSFTQCQATASENAGNSLDVDQLPSGSDGAFGVKLLNMGRKSSPAATTGPADFPGLTWSVSWLSDSLH